MEADNRINKVVIFAGGKGTRMSELTHTTPKPLVPVGGDPIVLHIMRHFYRQGYKEFILALGYRSLNFKQFFRDYILRDRDVSFSDGTMRVHGEHKEDWTVHLVETGLESTTGQRLHAVREYIGDDDFFLTYGDSISDVNFHEVEQEHYGNNQTLVTLTAVTKGEKFGILEVDETGAVTKFSEKSADSKQLINGGYMACSNNLLDLVDDNSGDFSFDTLSKLSKNHQLGYYEHTGVWKAMDSKRDHDEMCKLFKEMPELFGAGEEGQH